MLVLLYGREVPRQLSLQPGTYTNMGPQESVKTVTYHPEIKNEIDLTCLTNGVAAPKVNQYFKLKTIPLEENKKKVKKINMKKMKTVVNLAGVEGYDYGLSSVPPSSSDKMNLMIHSVFGARRLSNIKCRSIHPTSAGSKTGMENGSHSRPIFLQQARALSIRTVAAKMKLTKYAVCVSKLK